MSKTTRTPKEPRRIAPSITLSRGEDSARYTRFEAKPPSDGRRPHAWGVIHIPKQEAKRITHITTTVHYEDGRRVEAGTSVLQAGMRAVDSEPHQIGTELANEENDPSGRMRGLTPSQIAGWQEGGYVPGKLYCTGCRDCEAEGHVPFSRKGGQ